MTQSDPKAPRELTAEEIAKMAQIEEEILQAYPRRMVVDGVKYSVKQISKMVRARIRSLEIDAYFLSGKQKTATSAKQAKKIQRKLDVLHAKTAAYYLLNNKAIFMPWLFYWTWKKLMLRGEEHTAQINNAGVNRQEINFCSANWGVTELQLALSMKPIGDSVNQTLKRMESASQQVKEDATKKEEERK